jgi:Carbohydrate binding domain (family 11)
VNVTLKGLGTIRVRQAAGSGFHRSGSRRWIAGCLAIAAIAAGWSASESKSSPTTTGPEGPETTPVVVIQSYESGLAAIRAASAEVDLSLGDDPGLPGRTVLFVDYPAASDDPAGRDVWCDSETLDWTPGRAIAFQIKPEHAVRLSVSFLDRNGVAYTSWTALEGAVWQTVRIRLDQIRPNPYFQPPGANTDAPIDVSRVERIGFAPQSQAAGRLAVGRFVLVD